MRMYSSMIFWEHEYIISKLLNRDRLFCFIYTSKNSSEREFNFYCEYSNIL